MLYDVPYCGYLVRSLPESNQMLLPQGPYNTASVSVAPCLPIVIILSYYSSKRAILYSPLS